MSPIDILQEHLTGRWPSPSAAGDAVAVIAALKDAGWIIVRHDAIRLAQAHARDDARKGGGGIGPF